MPPDGFPGIGIGRRVEIQGIVLALARRDDAVPHGGHELHQFHAGRRLVPRAERIDHAQPLGLGPQISADGDVRLDVHHHQMLAPLHRAEADLRPDRGDACGVDHHVDQACVEQRGHVVGHGDAAVFHRRIGLVGSGDVAGTVGVAVGDLDSLLRGARLQFADRTDLHATHVRDPADDIRPHLARPDQAHANRLSTVFARRKVLGETCERYIRGHSETLRHSHCGHPKGTLVAGST